MKSYLVGLTILSMRQNMLIKVKANNHYHAVLDAMRRFTKVQANEYPEKRDLILSGWDVESERLTARCKDFDSLHQYLTMLGFIVSKPYLLESKDDHAGA